MSSILVTAATPNELTYLVRELDAVPLPFPGGWELWRGSMAGSSLEVTLAATGIGKVNTAWSLTCLLEQVLPDRPNLLINTGCGGAYSGKGLNVGRSCPQ